MNATTQIVIDLSDEEMLALYQAIDHGLIDQALKEKGWPIGAQSALSRSLDKIEAAIAAAAEETRLHTSD